MNSNADFTAPPSQQELPFAVVNGERLGVAPDDLYVPPEALRVFLETFEGPLDLLLYLIKKRNVDILEIDLLEITDQYLRYIDLMEVLQVELAGEYLVMAATLAEYKSRMLLPKPEQEEEEIDPRQELIDRLREYRLFKSAAAAIDAVPRLERELHSVCAEPPPARRLTPEPQISLDQLLQAMAQAQRRLESRTSHRVSGEIMSTDDRIAQLRVRLGALPGGEYTSFEVLCSDARGRADIVVTVLALLTMTFRGEVETRQIEIYGAIHVRAIADAS